MNVLLVDDHELVRRGLSHVVRECFADADVAEAGTPRQAMDAIRTKRPDVVLLDVRLGDDPDGLDLLREIKAEWTDVPVIMLTTYDHANYARRAMEEGASGYMLKDASPSDLERAVNVALAGGGNVMSPRVIQNLFEQEDDEAEEEDEATDIEPRRVNLTQRETQILELVVLGRSNRNIAQTLGVSEKTVKTHLAAMFRKLGVANRTQAAMAAVAMGIQPQYQPPEPESAGEREQNEDQSEDAPEPATT